MNEQTVQRGDVWYVRLSDPSTGRAARKSEAGGDQTKEPVRPCVVVSNDFFNDVRITVVPLNHYSEAKEDTMARWGATVSCEHSWAQGYEPIVGDWGGADPTRSNPEYPWKKSIVDCAQLWTVYCGSDDAEEVITLGDGSSYPLGENLARVTNQNALNDVKWKKPTARLTQRGRVDIESALQVVISGCLRLETPTNRGDYEAKRTELFQFQEGDVLNIDLPGRPEQRGLVVSSTPVDYLRAEIPCRGSFFGQVTVVPLFSPEETPHLVELADLPATGVAYVIANDTRLIAFCQEPYTIDWRARPHRGEKRPGRVPLPDLSRVRNALRFYLGLPSCDYESERAKE